jgi:hypothetical protein
VTGRRLVHLQCHIGLDTLSWARRGALVSGLDFSAPAIEAASSLAAELGLAARFVVADVYDAVAAFGGQRFDVVYTGIGALVWLRTFSERWPVLTLRRRATEPGDAASHRRQVAEERRSGDCFSGGIH